MPLRLHEWFVSGFSPQPEKKARSWLCLGLLVALAPCVRTIWQGFLLHEYAVPDDARQFMFWIQRFIDPELFQGDLIADYFSHVSPLGYVAVFRLAAALGLEPLAASNLLCLPLGLVMVYFIFRLSYRLLPVPGIALLAVCLAVLTMWQTAALVNGTPRAFAYALMPAFLGAVVSGSHLGVVTTIGLLSLFYPTMAAFAVTTVGLNSLRWTRRGPRLRPEKLGAALLGAAVFALAIAPFLLRSSEFGPTITKAQARSEPTFYRGGGRTPFFERGGTRWDHYVLGSDSGFLEGCWQAPKSWRHWKPVARGWAICVLAAMVALPVALGRRARRGATLAPGPEVGILLDVFLAGLLLFGLAHLLLFQLHIPSRYSNCPFRIAYPVTVALFFAPRICGAVRATAVRPGEKLSIRARVWLIATLSALALTVTVSKSGGVRIGRHGDLYRFVAGLPKDSMTASLHMEANNLPTFSQRSVLVSREHLQPYSLGYFDEMKRRLIAVARSVYAPEPAPLRELIEERGVDYLVIHDSEIGAVRSGAWWTGVIPEVVAELDRTLGEGATPVLEPLIQPCSVFQSDGFSVVEASCVGANIPTE